MPATAGPLGQVNGHRGPQPDLAEMLEYEKIVNLHDQIFSGNHPRLKVPQHVIRKVTPRSVQTPPLPIVPPIPAAELSAAPQTKVPPSAQTAPLLNGSAAVSEAAATPSPSGPSGHVTASKPVSEIDPIFLTKSDDLIRAEIQLQRQRIERSLRDQVEQKKIDYRQKTCLQESKPDFDVSDVLTKALQLVKPISTSVIDGANANTVASDSFDDNSFYSSKAPDSPQTGEPNDASPIRDQHMHPMEVDEVDSVDRRREEARPHDTVDRNMMDLGVQGPAYNNIADKRGPLSRSPENHTPRRPTPPRYPVREPDVYDEAEYSPPGPNIPLDIRRQDEGEYVPEPAINYRRRSYGRPLERGQDSRRIVSPSHDVRVVRNHITSPAAPQPSRVSPLAVSKVPSMPQSRQQQTRQNRAEKLTGAHGSARTSPEAPMQPLMSRKRRRIQENRDKPRVANEGRVADSPDHPYIKPEPMSPPPFSDLPLSGPSRQRQHPERPALVDVSPRYSPVDHRRESGPRRLYEEQPDRGYDMGHPIDLSVPRSASRVAYRRPARDDQNLRRVASLQNARQPEYAHEYPDLPADFQPRLVRASSYALTDRPVQPERARYYEEPSQSYARRYVSGDVSPPSPRFRETYPELEPEPRLMAPPQRRVVVDAEGNRYIESVAPPPSRVQPISTPRLTRVEAYNDAPRVPNGSVRAVSVLEDPYRDRRYAQEMPPPPVTYRRAPEYPREVVRERPVYSRDMDVEYAPPRHATYFEEPIPREEVVRMSSVRPPPSRYEEVRQPLQRMQSVRPSGREVSVYVDDEPRPRREYAPMERAGYAVGRPGREERYYEEEESSKIDMDGVGMHEAVQRVPRRY
ncbi:hypothetical protein FQN52_005816 [Onygenales sp. PD_12]|nr:hypothetical protein FQN52_005816 [Onygenales sp. PD_12]